MTYRIRDIHRIHNNQLNSSISKAQYSIPKADRFKHNKTQNYKYYQLPSTNQRKAPSFGQSERKTIFTIDKNTIPSPDKYFVNDQSSQKLDHQAISFAKGRQDCKNLNFLKVSQNPGPGTYNPNPEFIDTALGSKYSIRVRTENSEKLLVSNVPGPGNYNVRTAWLQKQKILSRDRKYGCPLIRPSKSRRQIGNEDNNTDVPYYNLRTTVKGEQTFNKTGGFSIGKSIRFNSRIKTQIPGPGTYDRFSEFI